VVRLRREEREKELLAKKQKELEDEMKNKEAAYRDKYHNANKRR